jgi:hypothetical protein
MVAIFLAFPSHILQLLGVDNSINSSTVLSHQFLNLMLTSTVMRKNASRMDLPLCCLKWSRKEARTTNTSAEASELCARVGDEASLCSRFARICICWGKSVHGYLLQLRRRRELLRCTRAKRAFLSLVFFVYYLLPFAPYGFLFVPSF